MKRQTIVLLAGLTVAASASSANAVDYTVTGNVYFKHFDTTHLVAPQQGAAHLFPPDTRVELGTTDALGIWHSVADCRTFQNGSYNFIITDPGTTKYKLRVWLQTHEGGGAVPDLSDPRVVIKAPIGLYFLESKSEFDFANADPANHTISVGLYVGDDADTDRTPVVDATHSGTLVDWKPKLTVGVTSLAESDLAKLAAGMKVVDTAYREIAAVASAPNGPISWFGTMHDWNTEGLRIVLGGLTGQVAGAISLPENIGTANAFTMRLRSVDEAKGEIMAHEFGHLVHYHSTAWTLVDLTNEFLQGGHFWWKHTGGLVSGTKVAFCEGWAEFFDTAFVQTHPALINTSIVYEPLVVTEASGPGITFLFKYVWKGDESGGLAHDPALSDGTVGSGEDVEGAVAQIMWSLRETNGTPTFVQTIEPVWQVVRLGATGAGGRNSMKNFHGDPNGEHFYDKWMTAVHIGDDAAKNAKRQQLRDESDKHGIVYTRMKFDKVKRAGTADPFVTVPDAPKFWVASGGAVFSLTELSNTDLQVTHTHGTVTEVVFKRLDASDKVPFDLRQLSTNPISDQLLTDPSKWVQFAQGDLTTTPHFQGTFSMPGASDDRYYLLRGEVEEEWGGQANFSGARDNMLGPTLGHLQVGNTQPSTSHRS